MAKENRKAEVVAISDRRAASPENRDEAPQTEQPAEEKPGKPKVKTVAEREQEAQQRRESLITVARESGYMMLLAKVRMGRQPTAADVINAVLDLGTRSDQANNLFQQAGRSFEQIAETLGAILGYLAAWEERRKLSWWRRWRTPRPEFPRLGPHVETEGEKKPSPAAVAETPAASPSVH